MDSLYCTFCKQDTDLKHFYQKHKIKLENYVYDTWDKKDLLTGEKIKFKNVDQYFETDFINKSNLYKWLESQPRDKSKEYLINILSKRIDKKNLFWMPTEVELKSLHNFPGIGTFEKYCGDYIQLCRSLGLNKRLDLPNSIDWKLDYPTVLIDTREQNPLGFQPDMIEVRKLDFGDYATWKQDLFIERKSLIDFIHSFGKDCPRLRKEFERVADSYLIVVVETSLSKALAFNKLPFIRSKVKVSPDFVFHNIRDLLQDFDNVQFLFCDGRMETLRVVKRLLSNPEQSKSADLQYLLQRSLL